MIILGLDPGERRIGVATTDPLGLTAQPLAVIERGSLEDDLARIEAIVKQRRADRIVLGLPLNMDGTVGPQAKRVRRFAARLKRALGLEIILWDERLTTVEAETVGQELVYPEQSRRAPAPREREKRRRRTDAVAAAVILQDYLESRRRGAK